MVEPRRRVINVQRDLGKGCLGEQMASGDQGSPWGFCPGLEFLESALCLSLLPTVLSWRFNWSFPYLALCTTLQSR